MKGWKYSNHTEEKCVRNHYATMAIFQLYEKIVTGSGDDRSLTYSTPSQIICASHT